MCAIVLTDHCEILIYFYQVTKVVTVSFKNKYKSLQGEEMYIVCYQKVPPRKLCSFNKERKAKFQFGTRLYSLRNNSYSLCAKSNSKKISKGS